MLPAGQGEKFPPGLSGLLDLLGPCLISQTLHSLSHPLSRYKETLCPYQRPGKGSLLAALSWVLCFSWWSRPLSSPGLSYFFSYLSSVSERIISRDAFWDYRVNDVHVEPLSYWLSREGFPVGLLFEWLLPFPRWRAALGIQMGSLHSKAKGAKRAQRHWGILPAELWPGLWESQILLSAIWFF